MAEQDDPVAVMAEGLNFVCHQSRLIAMMPIEDWLEALERAEAVGPIVDPTTYRKYLYSEKPEILKKVLRAALELKRVMQEIQPAVHREIGKQS